MPREREAVIDETSIKSASKQFDMTLVFKLSMPKMSIARIQNLHLVPSLTELDLSQNRIGRMEGLEGLDSLKRLVLANNEIARVEGLDGLDSLETLLLQGNRITSVDDLQILAALHGLRHLQMKGRGGEDRNPMCDHPAYRTAARRMLPALQTLDGERALLSDAALPKKVDALADVLLPEPEPWLRDFDWGDEAQVGSRAGAGRAGGGGALKGAAEFDALVMESKRLSAKAQSLVEDYRARTPR